MNVSLNLALVVFAVSLIGTLVVTTWRFSALTTRLLTAIAAGEEREKELRRKLEKLDEVPQMELRIGHLEKNHSLIPKLESRVVVVEQAVQFSKELRGMGQRRSKPDDES